MNSRNYSEDVQVLFGEIQVNRGSNADATVAACNKLLTFGKQYKDDFLVGFAYFTLGETYYLLNDTSNSYNQMLACIEPMERVKEWGYLAMANNMLGIVSLNKGNAPYALDYYIRAITICQDHSLPDLEWMIRMNLGSLYLNIEEYEKSIVHTEKSYGYLIQNQNIDGYTESLTTVLLGMGRAYIKLKDEDKILEIERKLKTSCLPFLQEKDKIVIYCFFARIHNYMQEAEARDYWIEKVNENTSSKMPIMDIFDDFYEYLGMLLTIEKYDDFFKAYNIIDDLTKKTSIKNLEKKLLTLKIRYYRRTGKIEEYKLSSVLFFELSEYMERENRLMVNSMIGMTNSYMELTQINRKVAQENTILQKRSETDALTGLYNRQKLNEYSENAFKKALINRTTIAIEILDIDYFKQYNDNYGHQAGDECIKYLADLLKEMSKEDNVFSARYGGDEFVIIYEGFKKEEVVEKVQKLRQKVMDGNFEHKFSLIDNKVTITQGVCYGTPKEGQSVFEFLQGADEMLYKVKQTSRNDFMICDC